MKSLLLLFFLCSLGLSEENAENTRAEESAPIEAIANLTDPKKLATTPLHSLPAPSFRRVLFLAAGYRKYEDLKKGDWVKISLNYEWASSQIRMSGQKAMDQRPKAIDYEKVWGCVNNKTKDYLTVQTYYILRRKQDGRFCKNPRPYVIEKVVLKNTQIKPTEIQSISLWNENEDPELPPAGRK